MSFQKSNLDVIGVGPLRSGQFPKGRPEYPVPYMRGAPLGQHLRVERLARVVPGRMLYLADNVNPLWQHRKCWACGERFNPGLANCCTFCGAPLEDRRFLASVRYPAGPRPGWQAWLQQRLVHPTIIAPVAGFYRDGHAVTVFPYNGERLLADQPAPLSPAVIVPLAHRLGVALQAIHDAGVYLEPFDATNMVVMPDGTARFIDLSALGVLDAHALMRHRDRPVLADVRRLCAELVRFVDPEQDPLVAFLEEGAAGRHGPPRRFCAALEQFHERLIQDADVPTHAGFTDMGLVRSRNEDAWGWRRIDDRSTVYVVSDGMGGQDRGQVASRITVDVVLDTVAAGVREGTSREDYLKGLLTRAVEEAHAAVRDEATSGGQAMGATVVVLLLTRGKPSYVAWAGDARVYLHRKGKLRRVTTDHSLVQAMVERGTVKPEDARTHPRANIILNHIGQEDDIDVDLEVVRPLPGDRWLLCSDGIWGEMDESEIAGHLQSWPEPRRCVQRLVRAAFDEGAKDNATAVVVDVRR